MPNGYHGSMVGWRELTGALEALDGELEAFASLHNLEIGRNERAWPNRQLRWSDSLERLIEVYLHDEHRRTYCVGVAAYVDRGGHRYGRSARLREDVAVEELVPELRELLERCYQLVSSWTFNDLEDTGPLS